MVYLTRTMTIIKFDSVLEEASNKLIAHLRSTYPQIKDLKVLWNVTGPLSQVHWVWAFDSLAAEDQWAGAVMRDKAYEEWFSAVDGVVGDIEDHLFREMQSMS